MWEVEVSNDFGMLYVTISKDNFKIDLYDSNYFRLAEYKNILHCITHNIEYLSSASYDNPDAIINYNPAKSELAFTVSSIGSVGDMGITISLNKEEAISVISSIIEKFRTQSFSEE